MHKNYFFNKQYCSTDLSKISLKFTDTSGFLEHLSVNGSDFVKCSTCSISTLRLNYGQSAVLELFVRNQAKISLKFTDKVPFFADLSVSKTHFMDKPAFSNDLSVKPELKRLNFYGQSAFFDHFVRNRHFSIEPFTDRGSIFIDVSVNAEKLWKNKLCLLSDELGAEH